MIKIIMIAIVSMILIPGGLAAVSWNVLRYNPSPAEPGSYFYIWVTATNNGNFPLNNLTFSIKNQYPFSVAQNFPSNISIGTLSPYETTTLSFKVMVAKDAPEGANQLEIYASANNYAKILKKFDIIVQPHRSLLYVANVNTPKSVTPNVPFNISFTLNNIGDNTVKNIIMTIGSSQSSTSASSSSPLSSSLGLSTTSTTSSDQSTFQFSLLNSTNTKIITLMSPGQNSTVAFTINTEPSVASQSYNIPVQIHYQDLSGNTYTQNSFFSIDINSQPKIEYTLSQSPYFYVNQSADFNIQLTNLGLSDVKYLRVTLLPSNDYILTSSNYYFIGTISANDYDTANFKIMPKSTGNIKIPFNYSYIDINNQPHTETGKVTIKSISATDAQKLKLIQASNAGIIFLIIIVIIIALIAYVIIRKKLKRLD